MRRVAEPAADLFFMSRWRFQRLASGIMGSTLASLAWVIWLY